MISLQKTIFGALFAIAVGIGIYEARQASQLREQNQSLQQQQAPLSEQLQLLERQWNDATNRLAMLAYENATLKSNSHELLRLRGEVGRLRKQAQNTSQSEANAASMSLPLQVPTNQKEFEEMRSQMAGALKRIGLGLRQFMTNNSYGVIVNEGGQLNKDVFGATPALPLDRFQILVRDVQHLALAREQQPKLIIAKSAAPLPFNRRWTRFYLLADGAVTTTTIGSEEEPTRDGFLLPEKEMVAFAEAHDPVRRILRPTFEAFAAANNGRRPTDPYQLQPYVTTPEQQAVLQEEINSRKSAEKP